MPEDRQDLEVRAKWCRRLARHSLDEHVRSSLQELAADLEGRALANQR